MNIYLIYISIILITLIFFIVIKDKMKALKLTGILTISSSLLLITIMFIIKLVINNFITEINISTITDYLFIKFIYTSIILFLIGLIEIIISKYIIILRNKAKA